MMNPTKAYTGDAGLGSERGPGGVTPSPPGSLSAPVIGAS